MELAVRLDPEELDDLLDHLAVTHLFTACPAEPQKRRERPVLDVRMPTEHEVVEHRQVLEQGDVLEHSRHAGARNLDRGPTAQVLAKKEIEPSCGR